MRLIDADKLIEICRKGWKLFGRENEKLKHWVDEYDINAQPTVQAIPTEWIERWLNNIENNERYKNEYVELTEEVKRIVYRQTVIIKIPCISDMLEDWRKENEINRRG